MTVFFDQLIGEIRAIFGDGPVPLHRPVFEGNERHDLVDCIDSNFVSSVGEKVTEMRAAAWRALPLRAISAVATWSTAPAALQVALAAGRGAARRGGGAHPGADLCRHLQRHSRTCEALRPVFVDVETRDPGHESRLRCGPSWKSSAEQRPGGGLLQPAARGRRLAACEPMHTFGQPCRIAEIALPSAGKWGIPVVEDAAESLGSYVRGRGTPAASGRLGAVQLQRQQGHHHRRWGHDRHRRRDALAAGVPST